jgi:hypothetical protein
VKLALTSLISGRSCETLGSWEVDDESGLYAYVYFWGVGELYSIIEGKFLLELLQGVGDLPRLTSIRDKSQSLGVGNWKLVTHVHP